MDGTQNKGDEPMSSDVVVSLQDLHKSFGTNHVLRGIDLEVTRGEVVCIIGPSGSGKSTLINLVIGFVRPTSGYISCDNARLESLDMRTLRKFISVVPQETVLFNASIKENISYGLPDVTDEQIANALAMANAQEFIDEMPEGLNTEIGERGASLSGGQRQRIVIARALATEPKLIICDEAVAALDISVQAQVLNLLNDLKEQFDLSYLFISHDLNVVKYMSDKIMVMQNGLLVEYGEADDLYINPKNTYTKKLIASIPKAQ